jgi:putative FmdB family regulatory protein
MPIYEYECQSCNKIKEAFQKFSDAPLTACPTCGGVLKKLISPSAFHLKGSGWYVTDYARSGSTGDGSAKPSVTAAEGESKTPKEETAKAPAKEGDTN